MAADTIGYLKTYPDLASKEAAVTGNDGECYSGANLGPILENSGSGLTYYAAAGHAFIGIDGDETTIASIISTGATVPVFDSYVPLKVRGIHIDNQNVGGAIGRAVWMRNSPSILDGLFVKQGGASAAAVAVAMQYEGAKDFLSSVVVIESDNHTGFYCTGTTGGHTHRIKHNTVINLGAAQFGLNNDGNANPVYEVENNIFHGFGTADYRNSGIFDTFNKCGSGDVTGSEAGLRSLMLADHLENVASNWNLKSTSTLRGAGADLSAESDLALDPFGTARAPAFDIGAMAYPALIASLLDRKSPRGMLRGMNRSAA